MAKSLRHRVEQRAEELCEYCHAQQCHRRGRFQIDHAIARQHGGQTTFDNPALCCLECNLRKGPNVAGIDPASGKVVPLFNPRTDVWPEHFRWDGARLVALTPEGRVTIHVLDLNHPLRLAIRQVLIEEGEFPPPADRRASRRGPRRRGR